MALPTSLTCATQTSSAPGLAFIAVLDVSATRFVAWPQPRRERADPSAECNPVDDSACAAFSMRTIRERGAVVAPFYATGVADRGPRDLLVIECMCQHRGRLTVRRNATTGIAADEPIGSLAPRLRYRECDGRWTAGCRSGGLNRPLLARAPHAPLNLASALSTADPIQC